MPLYLLDASMLITANNDYYPIDRLRSFWEWLIEQGETGHAKIPNEMYNEITRGSRKDLLTDWISQEDVKTALILKEEVDGAALSRVTNKAYAPDLKGAEYDQIGADPFLIAYSLMATNRVVVTKEVSATSKKRGLRKIPDACDIMDVRWVDDFVFYREMDFRIP